MAKQKETTLCYTKWKESPQLLRNGVVLVMCLRPQIQVPLYAIQLWVKTVLQHQPVCLVWAQYSKANDGLGPGAILIF